LQLASKQLHQQARLKNLPKLAITGTNGKTTTTGLLASCLTQQFGQGWHNHLGANMRTGIATLLLHHASLLWAWRKVLPAFVALELDEASAEGVSSEFTLDHMLVTNLFRDQLDRYGELDTTSAFVAKGAAHIKQTLWLNADDPLVAALAQRPQTNHLTPRYFSVVLAEGVSGLLPLPADSGPTHPAEVTDCPCCGAPLHYQTHTLGHLGSYACKQCHYQQPKATFTLSVLALTANNLTVQCHDTLATYADEATSPTMTLPLSGLYNAYNVAAALALARQVGVSWQAIAKGVATYQGVFGRNQRLSCQGRTIEVLLIKNPAGATETLRQVALNPQATVWVGINDDYADGRDISWLWDAPFESLACRSANQPVWVSGRRSGDMALRLLYGGIAEERIRHETDLLASLKQALTATPQGGTLLVLPTYTVLLALRFLWDELGAVNG
jgi:UDP-N-acetylmuramyl tripeptide synthase